MRSDSSSPSSLVLVLALDFFHCFRRKMYSRRNPATRFLLIVVLALIFVLYLQHGGWPCRSDPLFYEHRYNGRMIPKNQIRSVRDEESNKEYVYDREMPLIFIGGMPRSGTTLMRAMIDAHPEVRCGEETRLIPRLLGMRGQWQKSPKEWSRLQEAGLTERVIDDALSAFILEVIAKHGEPAPRLCNKDPFTLKSMSYLNRLFPNAKYLLMVRDGRATVHSIISRKVTITGFDLTSYKDCLHKWNLAIENMYRQCQHLGPQYCLPVYYEQLVLHPQAWMQKILHFLNVTWNDVVLHHEDVVGKKGGISLSRVEKSTDQVVKPVNLDALSKWVGHIPLEVVADMANIAPMLLKLGYNPGANPPNYGKPDQMVVDNTNRARKDQDTFNDNLKKAVGAEPLEPPQEGAGGGGYQGLAPPAIARIRKHRDEIRARRKRLGEGAPQANP